MSEIFKYTGQKLGSTYNAELEKMPSVHNGQDGTVINGRLFRFDADGSCHVYILPDMKPDGVFVLDKSDILKMHCNAVDFSGKYAEEGDEYPLIYTNIYNNYSSGPDRLEGVCGVYRIWKRGDGTFSSSLMQIIRVGFTGSDKLWCSPSHNDVRPYGNFVVDRTADRLAAFTMRDSDYHTRIFCFRLPDISEGVYSDYYGVNLLTLTEDDILSVFNGGYSNYIQGACCADGKIYSTEGFDGPQQPAGIRVFDLNRKCQTAYLPLFSWGYENEPEFIAAWEDGFIYSDARGNAWKLKFN